MISSSIFFNSLSSLSFSSFLSERVFITALSVGRLSYEKNILTSAKAVAEMIDEDFKYVIVGDGPQKAELEKIISSSFKIELKGSMSRNQVLQCINEADIVLIPSLWEGRSIFMLEAAAFDKPFIISDCPGLREPFGEPELKKEERMRVCDFGYLVKTNDTAAYEDAIRHFIKNKELHKRMASYVRVVSLQNDIDNVIANYLKTFREA